MAYLFGFGESGLGRSATRQMRLALVAAQIPTLRNNMPAASAELRRARRYERSMSVLVLGMNRESLGDSASAPGGDPVGSLSRFECAALVTLGWLLRDTIRESDLVSYDAEHHLYTLVLPELGAEEAEGTAARLKEAFLSRASVALCAGIAEFPADGITLEDLFARAREAFEERLRGAEPPLEVEQASTLRRA